MLVYRVEYTDERGPYTPAPCSCRGRTCRCEAEKRERFSIRLNDSHIGDRWPTTYSDKAVDYPGKTLGEMRWERMRTDSDSLWLHGFENHYALSEWFEGWAYALAKNGYVVSTYEVPDSGVIRGTKQVIFLMESATLIDLRYPTDIFA